MAPSGLKCLPTEPEEETAERFLRVLVSSGGLGVVLRSLVYLVCTDSLGRFMGGLCGLLVSICHCSYLDS